MWNRRCTTQLQNALLIRPPFCHALRAGLAEQYALCSEAFFCGNGASEILFRLAQVLRPRTALLTAPSFAEYEASLRSHGTALRFHLLRREEDFAITERLLDDLTDEVDILYLCNPNNPTGQAVDETVLQAIVTRCQAIGCWLVLDECFCDFVIEGQRNSLLSALKQMPRLIVLRSFTKLFAIPGVRLGWCASANDTLIKQLYMVGKPWNVNVFAQCCGVAALAECDYAERTAAFVAQERLWLTVALRACGLKVYDSAANFLLFHTRDTALSDKLRAKGILIRNCSNYRGLEPGDFRVAVRTHQENVQLIEGIQACLEG